MAQVKTVTWTNASSAVARNQDFGFVVAEITTVDTTNGGSWYWNSQMNDAAALDVDAGTIATTNGFTPLNQGAIFGQAISAFTNANPGVITVADAVTGAFAAGDTIRVAGIADDGTGTNSLNQASTFTIASISGNALTLDQNTSVTTYSVWVSGGFASRVSDTDGVAIATVNQGIRGITIGTTPVGANSAVMVAVAKSEESVT